MRRLPVLVLTLALLPPLLTSAPAAAGAPRNLVRNAGFESGIAGWTTRSPGVLQRGGAAHAGSYAGRLRNAGGQPATLALNDRVNTVRSTSRAVSYEATAWVRTQSPGVTVNLRLMEFTPGNRLVGQANSSVWLRDTSWHPLRVRRTAAGAGNSLDLNVVAWGVPGGGSFDVDDVALVRLPGTPATRKAPGGRPAAPSGWRLRWHDEFTGTSLDTTKWNAEHQSTYGDGNNELACLTNRRENVQVSGGVLVLRARREPSRYRCGNSDRRFPDGRAYTSAHLTTRGKASWTYGRFEIRAKLPTTPGSSKGLWPAFWLRPEAGGTGELDVVEAVGTAEASRGARRISQTLHYDYRGTHPMQAFEYRLPRGSTTSDFHTYAAEWERGEIRWYVDGVLTSKRTRATTPWIDEAFSKPFFLRLNLAVGGNWPGAPDARTRFPGEYVVDWVRVYSR